MTDSGSKVGEKSEDDLFLVDNVRADPAAMPHQYIPNFEVYDYLQESENPNASSSFANANLNSKDTFSLKTEAFYMMKYEHVFGTIILRKDRLEF